MKYLFWILLICMADQGTKYASLGLIASRTGIPRQMLTAGAGIPVIGGVLDFTYVQNSGMSFGLLKDARWVFMVISTLAIVGFFVYLLLKKDAPKLQQAALTLVIGGGLGNMFDRVLLGYVVDFVDVRCIPYWHWVFNFADACVCVGAALLALSLILEYRKEKKSAG